MLSEVLAKERGKTVLLSTHNLWEAQEICDTIAVLKKGKLSAIGTPSEIRFAYVDNIQITLNLLLPFKSAQGVSNRIQAIDGIIFDQRFSNRQIG